MGYLYDSMCCDYESWGYVDNNCFVWANVDSLQEQDMEVFENDVFEAFVFTHKQFEEVEIEEIEETNETNEPIIPEEELTLIEKI